MLEYVGVAQGRAFLLLLVLMGQASNHETTVNEEGATERHDQNRNFLRWRGHSERKNFALLVLFSIQRLQALRLAESGHLPPGRVAQQLVASIKPPPAKHHSMSVASVPDLDA
jgi:hypothetical protein